MSIRFDAFTLPPIEAARNWTTRTAETQVRATNLERLCSPALSMQRTSKISRRLHLKWIHYDCINLLRSFRLGDKTKGEGVCLIKQQFRIPLIRR
jgi:hypothetical protein